MFTNLFSSDSYIGLGSIVLMDFSTETSYWDFSVPVRDAIPYMLGNRTLLRHGVRTSRSTIDFVENDSDLPTQVKIRGTVPRDTGYNASLDRSNYGNILSDLGKVVRGWDGERIAQSLVKEHNVSHSTFVGGLRSFGNLGRPFYYEDGSAFGYGPFVYETLLPYDTWFRFGPKNVLAVVPTLEGYVFEFSNTHSTYDSRRPRAYFDDVLSYIEESIGDGLDTGLGVSSPGYDWFHRWIYSDFEHNHSPGTDEDFFIEYTFAHQATREWRSGWWESDMQARRSEWRVRYEFSISIPPSLGTNYTPGIYQTTMVPMVTIRRIYQNLDSWYKSFAGDESSWTEATIDDMSGGSDWDSSYWSYPTQTDVGAEADLDGFLSFRGPYNSRAQYNLEQNSGDFKNLSPSHFYSSVDALEKFSKVLSTNHLETLKELPDIVRLIPDAALLIRALVDLKKGDVGGFVLLGDFIAETQLKYGFGIAPTIEAIQELNDKGQAIVEQFNLLGKTTYQTLNGKFVYSLPEGYIEGTGPCELITRSKIRAKFTNTAFLATLLGYRSVGLLPELGALWELFPGSFIVDWFTNVGQRISDVDDSALLLMLEVDYCVHSYTILGKYTDEFLDQWSLQTDDVSPGFFARVYIRHVSTSAPVMRPSTYDFRSVAGVPSSGIVGALLWTVLRS